MFKVDLQLAGFFWSMLRIKSHLEYSSRSWFSWILQHSRFIAVDITAHSE
jgi:hypothetical protein